MSGKLVGADPEIRNDKNGKPFTTAKVSVPQDGDERVLVSAIAFGSAGETLARLKKGDDVSIVGRASVSAWNDKTSGEPKGGLRVVVDQILSAYQVAQRRKPRDEGGAQ